MICTPRTTVNIKGGGSSGGVAANPFANLTPGLPTTGDRLVTGNGKTLSLVQKVSSTGILLNGWEIA